MHIDWDYVEAYAGTANHGSLRRIAAALKVTPETLSKQSARRYGKSWAELCEYLLAERALKLEKSLWDKAEAGDKTVAMFLAKTRLGYSDTQKVEVSGPGGAPIQFMAELSALTTEQLRERRLAIQRKLDAGHDDAELFGEPDPVQVGTTGDAELLGTGEPVQVVDDLYDPSIFDY